MEYYAAMRINKQLLTATWMNLSVGWQYRAGIISLLEIWTGDQFTFPRLVGLFELCEFSQERFLQSITEVSYTTNR